MPKAPTDLEAWPTPSPVLVNDIIFVGGYTTTGQQLFAATSCSAVHSLNDAGTGSHLEKLASPLITTDTVMNFPVARVDRGELAPETVQLSRWAVAG